MSEPQEPTGPEGEDRVDEDLLAMAEASPQKIMEEAGVGYDPLQQPLDLSKEEKRRVTALMMAIQAYRDQIIKDATYLREVADLARRGEGPKLTSATIDAVVEAAIKFDAFIATGAAFRIELHIRRHDADDSEPEPEGRPAQDKTETEIENKPETGE